VDYLIWSVNGGSHVPQVIRQISASVTGYLLAFSYNFIFGIFKFPCTEAGSFHARFPAQGGLQLIFNVFLPDIF
jgi:hypothetical protein